MSQHIGKYQIIPHKPPNISQPNIWVMPHIIYCGPGPIFGSIVEKNENTLYYLSQILVGPEGVAHNKEDTIYNRKGA